MRYQSYKAKMLKIRKIMDFFHRFRFVFLGVTVAIVATVVTLDVTKGNITKVSEFEVSYQYGQGIQFSGESFMGDVTFEFRKVGDTEWTTEVPRYVGAYETRAVSAGNHGNKYSKTTTFEITPIEATFAIKNDHIDYGDDSPELTYQLLAGDRLADEYSVSYADLTKNQTTANINLGSLKILDKDNIDVTSCYTIKTEEKEITFNKKQIVINFTSVTPHEYDGNDVSGDDYTFTGELQYEDQIKIEGGKSLHELTDEKNNHTATIVTQVGEEEVTNENYEVTVNDNNIVINKAQALTISSPDCVKEYDAKPFNADKYEIQVDGLLPIHEIVDVEFKHINDCDVKDCEGVDENGINNNKNSFTYKIIRKGDEEKKDVSGYYQAVNYRPGTFSITKKPITITANSGTFDFDNTKKSAFGFDEDEVNAQLADPDNERVAITSEKVELLAPGKVDNVQAYKIYRDREVDGVITSDDITNNYTINPVKGSIEINQKKLKFNFTPQTLPYDGNYHTVYANNNKAVLDDEYLENLHEGWEYEVSFPKTFTMKNYKQQGYEGAKKDITVHIWTDNTHTTEVTEYYDFDKDFEFTLGESRIEKRSLQVTIDDYEKQFDNKTLSETMVIDPEDANSLVKAKPGDLLTDDFLTVDYGKSTDKDIKTVKADEETYVVPMTFGVVHKTDMGGYFAEENVTINYDIKSVSKDDETVSKNSINAKITYKTITITLNDVEKIYDGNNEFTPKFGVDSSELTLGENVSVKPVSAIKKYTVESADANESEPYVYSISPDDIVVKIEKSPSVYEDLSTSYNVVFNNTGHLTIHKRDAHIYQIDATKDYILYDNKEHGVSSIIDGKVQTVQSQTDDTVMNIHEGFISTHKVTYTTPFTRTDPGTDNPSASFDANGNEIMFGTKVLDAKNNDVTKNYNISFPSYFRINVIKKHIEIKSKHYGLDDGTEQTGLGSLIYFDGSEYDPESKKTPYSDTPDFDITTMNMFLYNIYIEYEDYNGLIQTKTEKLDTGDKIKVTKTLASEVEKTKEAGDYENKFNFDVVNKNNVSVKDTNYVIDPISYGTIRITKASIEVECLNQKKQYDGKNIDLPSDSFRIDYNSQKIAFVRKSTARERGNLLKNFSIKPIFSSASYENYYTPGTYSFTMTGVQIYDKRSGEEAVYDGTSIECAIVAARNTYNSEVSKRNIRIVSQTIKQYNFNNGTETVLGDIRYVDNGTLASGDILYFGPNKDEQQNNNRIGYEQDFYEYHIYRGNVEVTSTCYNITTLAI